MPSLFYHQEKGQKGQRGSQRDADQIEMLLTRAEKLQSKPLGAEDIAGVQDQLQKIQDSLQTLFIEIVGAMTAQRTVVENFCQVLTGERQANYGEILQEIKTTLDSLEEDFAVGFVKTTGLG